MGKISAVICELNPAHEGHKYIFDCAGKYGDIVIAIMSGNYVQRGENAIYDKYIRAESALDIGADLVVELPFPWSCASAEYFAAAATHIAVCLGVDYLVFGSECGNKDVLYKAADILKQEQFNQTLPGKERAAEVRERMLKNEDPSLPEDLLSSSNDILGIEYIKNSKNMECVPVKRISCDSATAIRKKINENLVKYPMAVSSEKLFDLEYIKFRLALDKEFTTAECNGGVGSRLYKAACKASNGLEMLDSAKTKQYTDARLRRCALYYLMNNEAERLKESPLFTQVLAFNDKGREVLSGLRKKTDISILTKPSAYESLTEKAKKQVKNSHFADSVYTLLSNSYVDKDYFIKKSPIKK